jgi:hypothetical protein
VEKFPHGETRSALERKKGLAAVFGVSAKTPKGKTVAAIVIGLAACAKTWLVSPGGAV